MLKLFYHIYTTDDQYGSLFFVDEQIKRLQYSELIYEASCFAVITGPAANAVWYLVDRSRRFRILDYDESPVDPLYEGRTLKQIYDLTTEDDQIIYIHTKGISYLLGDRTLNGQLSVRNFKAINGWRDTMEHYCIDQWQQRLAAKYWHTQGCFLRTDPWPHYMGNMWWAQGSYIRSLPDPLTFPVKSYPGMQFAETAPERMRYEQWILLNPGAHMDLKPIPKNKNQDGYTSEFTPYEDELGL